MGALVGASTVAPAQGRDLARAAGAAAGVAASIYGHELGHALAFRWAGADEVQIVVPGEQCRLLCGATHARLSRPPSHEERRWISTAGLLSSNLIGEALLSRRSLARSGAGQGFIAANLYSNAFHVYSYYTRTVGVDGYRGNDIDQFASAGGNPHLLSAALVGYSLYAVRRMRDREIPLMFVSLRF